MRKIVLLISFITVTFMACAGGGAEKLPLLAEVDFETGKSEGWSANFPDHWQVVEREGSRVYALMQPGQRGKVSAPTSISLLSGIDVASFEFSGRVKCLAAPDNPNRDMCVYFHYRDPSHFYYVHFSASSDDRHNIIGLVNGSDRVKVNLEPAGETEFRLTDTEWHNFRVTYDTDTGMIRAYLDDMETALMTANGSVFGSGLVGVGSYDDTGWVDDITLKGSSRED